jgi:hypothetical protein
LQSSSRFGHYKETFKLAFPPCNFLGRRERNSFIVLGQRDNGISSKSCHGMGQAGTAYQNPGPNARWDGTITIFLPLSFPVLAHLFLFWKSFSCFRTSFLVLECHFPVLECPFPVFCLFWESDFGLAHPGTEEFVP